MMTATAGQIEFVQLLEQIADNKYVLGDRLVEVGVSGPDLEATLCAIAMAQGELGHARLLYNWAFDLKGAKGKKPEVVAQTGKAFQTVVAISDWIDLIAVLYVTSLAVHQVLAALLETRHPDVASRIHKLVKEQKEHLVYARNWAEQLLSDQGAIPDRCRARLQQAASEAEEWLLAVGRSAGLIAGRYLLNQADLASAFRSELDRTLEKREKRAATHVN